MLRGNLAQRNLIAGRLMTLHAPLLLRGVVRLLRRVLVLKRACLVLRLLLLIEDLVVELLKAGGTTGCGLARSHLLQSAVVIGPFIIIHVIVGLWIDHPLASKPLF